MISDNTIRKISEIFIGDSEENYYKYKSGPKIVEFFNEYFGFEDVYYRGFPSRWLYTQEKIKELLNNNKFDEFINLILNKRFVMRDNNLNDIEAISRIDNIIEKLNKELSMDEYKLLKINGKYKIISQNKDLKYIGEGGFAKVYESISTRVILKKLKDEFKTDKGIRLRFRREYDLTKSLADLEGIIEVYTFDDSNYSYTMEKGEKSLEDYVNNYNLSNKTKINIIRQVLGIIKEVHNRDIVHRDISPNNILLFKDKFKVCDFGLGKNLDMIHSYRTMGTQGIGQYNYCAPEQLMKLGAGDKRSDVFSLGRLVNFIMTKEPLNNKHFLRRCIEKATSENTDMRYLDAGEFLNAIEAVIVYKKAKGRDAKVRTKIKNNVYDTEVENYIFDLDGMELCKCIIEISNMDSIVLNFIKNDEKRAVETIELIYKYYLEVCHAWEDYDKFGNIAYKLIFNNYTYIIQEMAANILYCTAHSKNRFSMQRKIKSLINRGIDPMIEDILNGNR